MSYRIPSAHYFKIADATVGTHKRHITVTILRSLHICTSTTTGADNQQKQMGLENSDKRTFISILGLPMKKR